MAVSLGVAVRGDIYVYTLALSYPRLPFAGGVYNQSSYLNNATKRGTVAVLDGRLLPAV